MSALATSLANLAAQAGFPASQASIAAAVAMAESSGNPNAIGDSGNSYGLWQINLPAHPEFAGVDLLDPQTNANAAFRVWQAAGGSFSPWTTYRTGAFQQYLTAPVSSPFSPSTSALVIPSPAAAPGFDWSSVAIALGLVAVAGFALSEA